MQSEKFSDNVSEEGVAKEFLTAGDMLREERLRQNISDKEVGDQLHITAHYVRALESNNYEKLPGDVFVKGYLKA
jgi:cytoskeleton protein RodZ